MPSGEHPFDGDMILIKKKNKNKNNGFEIKRIYQWRAKTYDRRRGGSLKRSFHRP